MIDFKGMKKKLFAYSEISEKVRNLNRELNRYMEQMMQSENILRANVITDMPHSTDICNPTLEAVERIVDRYERQIRNIADRINTLLDEKDCIERLLETLTSEQRRIIELRYVLGYKWYRIPMHTHYSRSQCFNIHDEAVSLLVGKYNTTFVNKKAI